jgi:uncharacterized protein (TIGR03435 family)
VKPSEPGGAFRIRETPTGIQYHQVNLFTLIVKAYQIEEFQLEAPSLTTQKWDIDAQFDSKNKTSLPLMLQRLLEERFRLKVHRRSVNRSVFALVQAPAGMKVKPVDAAPASLGGRRSSSGGIVWKGRVPLAHLAEVLSATLHQPVIDLTGIEGVFDIEFETDAELGSGDAGSGAPITGSSISSAMNLALGLKLEARKMMVEMLVVDTVDKIPTAN